MTTTAELHDTTVTEDTLHSPRVTPALVERLLGRVSIIGKRKVTRVVSPFTGELLAEVPLGTPNDVEEAVRRARIAQREWARMAYADRAKVFVRLHDMVLERQDEILDILQLEGGKSRSHAFEEVADVAIVCRYYAHHGERHLRPVRRRGALPGLTETWEHHHPRGVIGFISPWNYPLTLAVTDAIPALLAGNAVVLKPDRLTPLAALWAVDLLIEAGLPDELFQVVTGAGQTLGAPMIEHVDFIGFTGSTATGRIIARQAGERLIHASLELGGKNPMIVFADADIDKAARGAVRGCFANAGQLCISIERLFVESSVREAFVRRFVELTRALSIGPALDYETEIGSLISESQLRTVQSHVDDAVEKGATVLAGGRHRPDLGPYFYEPTILDGVGADMTVFASETFGPVVSIYSFDGEEEAIEKANATTYGLNASVWTHDTDRGMRIATQIQAGTVNINESYAATWASLDAPMGGFKDSGLGRRHGAEGIVKYTEAQTVSVQRLMPLAAPPGVGQERYAKVMSTALKVLERLPGIR